MATKAAKIGDKRKTSAAEGKPSKPVKKAAAAAPSKKSGPESTRKLWHNEDASDDSSDDSSAEDDGDEEEQAAPPTKKAKPAASEYDNSNSADQSAKKFEKGESSRESHIKQKQLAKDRKAARPLAEELQRTKKIWERLRRKSHVPKEERQKLVDELFDIITGRVKDFVLKHDAVRAVQTALKYAKPEQRKVITKELQGTYAQLAESKYAKFLIGKMLVQNDPEIRDLIIPEFYGKVRKLINHPEASWILDDIYRGVATKQQKATILREWYGPEFSLFRSENKEDNTAELSEILEEHPEKRGPIIKYLMSMIDQLVQKKMNGFTMLHDAMLQCFLNLKAGTEEHTEFLQKVKDDETGDLLKNLAFTKSGSRLACLLLAHGGAKDRRQYLKLYKETFEAMCGDQYAHLVILTAYDVIDDTVMTAKSIFPEILGKHEEKHNIIFCANNINARTTVLYPFEGLSRALFPLSLNADFEILKEVHEIRKTTSKKDPEIRRKELVTAMSPSLLDAIATSARDLVSTSFGCQFITDVLLDADSADKTSALQAVAEAAGGDPVAAAAAASEELYTGEFVHPSQTAWAERMFKTLIQGGRYDKATRSVKPVEPALDFANILYPIIKDHIVAWSTSRCSFVVVALLESDSFSQKEKIKKVLNKHKAELEKAATTPIVRPEAAAEQQEEEKAGAGKRKKGAAVKKDRQPAGNAGARILLQKL
ncbi:armadillo-type protein [Coniella lustricola]|uniref:Armadillo-type protein n=1 Tax=Coniella lustricola TaxID=2025994 RepID=A0A2T3AIP6_9PEZI|nr:armadillo-type protein [Coniella lustricola]